MRLVDSLWLLGNLQIREESESDVRQGVFVAQVQSVVQSVRANDFSSRSIQDDTSASSHEKVSL